MSRSFHLVARAVPAPFRFVGLLALLAGWPVAALVVQDPKHTSPAPAAAASDLRARSLEIVDDQGRARLRLGIDERGSPELRMLDVEGRTRLRTAVHGGDEPVVFLTDSDGKNRLALVVDKAGTPFVLLAQAGGKPAAQLSVSQLGAPSLVFTHTSGAMNAGIGQHADGTGWIKPEPATPAKGTGAEPSKDAGKDAGNEPSKDAGR